MTKKLTLPQAAERLGVHHTLVHRYVVSGRIPAERIGHAYLIRETDLKLIKNLKRGRPKKTND
jgi:excisionase family DNA binding protein